MVCPGNEYHAYYEKHVEAFGYPPSFTRATCKQLIHSSLDRLYRMSKLGCPAVIIDSEEKILNKRLGYALAWLRDNPSASILE